MFPHGLYSLLDLLNKLLTYLLISVCSPFLRMFHIKFCFHWPDGLSSDPIKPIRLCMYCPCLNIVNDDDNDDGC